MGVRGLAGCRLVLGVVVTVLLVAGCSSGDEETAGQAAPPPGSVPPNAVEGPTIDAVLLHAPVRAPFQCADHPSGQLPYVGDALGTDCMVVRFTEKGFMATFEGDGRANEDWYGWNEELLAPFDGTIEVVRVNPRVNRPGRLGNPPTGSIIFLRPDGLHVIYGHVQDFEVKLGDVVKAGQPVGRIGNNGVARNPHVHIGAWRGLEPFQIRFDQRTMRNER
jgi:hypothetical protein